MNGRLVVLGASRGGVSAITSLVTALPATFPAPILIAHHIGTHPSILPQLITRRGRLGAVHAKNGEALEPGRVLIAPPDHHLIVDGDRVAVTRGPKENFARPAIDPLFRTAALAHGPAVIGVVLTGGLDDGTVGLKAIKACGGVTIVQNPHDAEAPSMPASALRFVEVDYCVDLSAMPALLVRLLAAPFPEEPGVRPEEIRRENEVALSRGDVMETLDSLGNPSRIACPECGGVLWQMGDKAPLRYRCYTGHSFTIRSLEQAQLATADDELWTSFRMLQEREFLLRELAQQYRKDGHEGELARLDTAVEELARAAKTVRGLIETAPASIDPRET